MGFSRQEYWSGLPRPVPRDLPSLGIKPASPVSPALAGGFFTTSITWKALVVNSRALPQVRLASPPPPPGPLPRLCEPDVLSSCQRDGKSWLQAGFRGLLARQCSHSAWHAACVQCCGPGCLSPVARGSGCPNSCAPNWEVTSCCVCAGSGLPVALASLVSIPKGPQRGLLLKWGDADGELAVPGT